MTAFATLLAIGVTLQVPPPDSGLAASDSLRTEHRSILDREAKRLNGLALQLEKQGDSTASAEVRRDLPRPTPPDGASRFVPLPEVVARPSGLEKNAERLKIRTESAQSLFDLATRAASVTPKHYAIADACLREVIERQPDHAEARRLLGFVSYEGGWATPFAVGRLRAGMTLHATYGWVKSSWVPHLEKGELPSRLPLIQGREVWIPADDADAERRNWQNAWTINTEHFEIRTNVPLSQAISFGRHLEVFHALFESLLADVIGNRLPLAERFRNKKLTGEPSQKPHEVSYFATKDEFVDHLHNRQPDIDKSLGLYLPPESASQKRGHAYFFFDPHGEIAETATLFHEVSHQLLFESGIAKVNEHEHNVGNFWVFEGLGTYFETVILEPDGSIEVGGLVGPRIAEARKTLVPNGGLGAGGNLPKGGRMVPLDRFVKMGKDAFNTRDDVYLHYQQAIALSTFLMQASDGAYRDDFLEYVKSACQGRLRSTTGRSLEDRIGKPYGEIEAELVAYLKAGLPDK